MNPLPLPGWHELEEPLQVLLLVASRFREQSGVLTDINDANMFLLCVQELKATLNAKIVAGRALLLDEEESELPPFTTVTTIANHPLIVTFDFVVRYCSLDYEITLLVVLVR